jgi:hypothetical protein
VNALIPATVPATATAQESGASAAEKVERPAADDFKKTQRIAALADAPAQKNWGFRVRRRAKAAGTLGLALWAKVLSGLVAGLRKTKGLVGARWRRGEAKPVFPRLGKPAVQTELSLENVRVVRNDLEESDLEVVTSPTATSTQVAPQTAPAQARRGPVPPALKKLTERLAGAKPS